VLRHAGFDIGRAIRGVYREPIQKHRGVIRGFAIGVGPGSASRANRALPELFGFRSTSAPCSRGPAFSAFLRQTSRGGVRGLRQRSVPRHFRRQLCGGDHASARIASPHVVGVCVHRDLECWIGCLEVAVVIGRRRHSFISLLRALHFRVCREREPGGVTAPMASAERPVASAGGRA